MAGRPAESACVPPRRLSAGRGVGHARRHHRQDHFEYTDGYGATIIDQSRDYLVHAADLVLGGERTLPLSGDTIEETDGGETYVYEVTALGPEPAYRYSDAAGSDCESIPSSRRRWTYEPNR